jgi:hypothetical protein
VGNNVVDFDLIIRHVLMTDLANIVITADNLKHDVAGNIPARIPFFPGLCYVFGHRKNRTDMSEDVTRDIERIAALEQIDMIRTNVVRDLIFGPPRPDGCIATSQQREELYEGTVRAIFELPAGLTRRSFWQLPVPTRSLAHFGSWNHDAVNR